MIAMHFLVPYQSTLYRHLFTKSYPLSSGGATNLYFWKGSTWTQIISLAAKYLMFVPSQHFCKMWNIYILNWISFYALKLSVLSASHIFWLLIPKERCLVSFIAYRTRYRALTVKNLKTGNIFYSPNFCFSILKLQVTNHL